MLERSEEKSEQTLKKEEFKEEQPISSSDKNIFSVMLSKEDITCPITGEIFFEPMMANCGHLFEEEAIKNWLEINKNNAKDSCCPLCRQNITSISPAPVLFKTQIEQILKQAPELQNERYFNFERFYTRCLTYVREEKSSPEPLKKFIALLSASPEKLNAIREEKGHEGETAALILILAFHCSENLGKSGDIFLNHNLLTLMTSQSLGSIVKKETALAGSSAITQLLEDIKGIKFVANDLSLQNKITSGALNAIIHGQEMQGYSGVLALVRSKIGRQLLCDNSELRNRISPEGLNSIYRGTDDGLPLGISAVYQLALASNCDDGDTALLILSDPKIQDMITPFSLNAELINENSGMTPLYWLTRMNKVQDLLLKSPALYNKITEKGLNARVQDGIYRETSALFYLCRTLAGIDFILGNPELRKNIHSDTLNAIAAGGKYSNTSAAYSLCASKTGKEILRIDPELRSKINEKSLNMITPQGDSAATWLTGPKGIEILTLDPVFRSKINGDGLNATMKEGVMPGGSAVYGLCKNPEGHRLLIEDARLRELITKEALYSIIKTSEGDPDNGKSAAFWLINAKTPESEKLLEDPVLRNKLGLPIKKEEEKITPQPMDKKKEIAESRYQYFSNKLQTDPSPAQKERQISDAYAQDQKKSSVSPMIEGPLKEKKEEARTILAAIKSAQIKYETIHSLKSQFIKAPFGQWIDQLENKKKNENQILTEIIQTFHQAVRDYRGFFNNDTYDVVGKRYIQFLNHSEKNHIFHKQLLVLLKEFAPEELRRYGENLQMNSGLNLSK